MTINLILCICLKVLLGFSSLSHSNLALKNLYLKTRRSRRKEILNLISTMGTNKWFRKDWLGFDLLDA